MFRVGHARCVLRTLEVTSGNDVKLHLKFHLRWLDIVFQGQYLPSLSVNYVAINKDLEKLIPQLY